MSADNNFFSHDLNIEIKKQRELNNELNANNIK